MATYTGIKKIKIGSNVFELAVDASTSITSGTTDTSYYNNNVSMQRSTGSIYVGGSYYMYLNENTSDALYSAISDLGWTTDVIE